MNDDSPNPAPIDAEDSSVEVRARYSRETGFRISAWVMTLVLLLLSPAQLVFLGWVTDAYRDTTASSEVSHRLHEVVFGVFFTLALVGAISQLVTKHRNLAGLIQLAVTVLMLLIMVTVTVRVDLSLFLYLLPLLGMLAFHGTVRPLHEGRRFQPWAAGLTFVALTAFLAEITGHIARAQSGAQNHTTHWSVMAAFSAVLLILGLVVTLGIRGYRLVAWSLAGASMIYGTASLAFPYDASSHRFAYSIVLIVWGLAWATGVLIHKPIASPRTRRRFVRWVLAVLAIPFVIGVPAVIPFLDTPANVPHRPDPNQPDLMAVDADRATCLSCHAAGVAGAPQPPPDHSLNRTCDGSCWGGRTDCAGCHSIDPALGGPVERIEVNGAPDSLYTALGFPRRGQALSAGSLSLLESIGSGR